MSKTLKTFVNENRDIALEIASLHKIGYPLTRTQGELTIPQKIFVFEAMRIFEEETRKEVEGGDKKVNRTTLKELMLQRAKGG